MKKEVKPICAICEHNNSIVKNEMPACYSCCSKYKNRLYTIWKNKQNAINPVTGKPHSECEVPNYVYGYPICDVAATPKEFKLCSDINKGDCKHYEKTTKKPYIYAPKCLSCGAKTKLNIRWSFDKKIDFACHECSIEFGYDSKTVKKLKSITRYYTSHSDDYASAEYKERQKEIKRLEIKHGLREPELPKKPPLKNVPKFCQALNKEYIEDEEKSPWWRFWK